MGAYTCPLVYCVGCNEDHDTSQPAQLSELRQHINTYHDEQVEKLADLEYKVEWLQPTIDATRENVWLALNLLEHPVFSNDTERALDILRVMANDS